MVFILFHQGLKAFRQRMLHLPNEKRCIEKAILKNTRHAVVMGGFPFSFAVALHSAALVFIQANHFFDAFISFKCSQ